VQLITEVIGSLDDVKMRAAATISFEECAPFVLRIKNVLLVCVLLIASFSFAFTLQSQNIQQVKPLVRSDVSKIDKSALRVNTEDKLTKAQNAVKVFALEVQAILQAILAQADQYSLAQWSAICDNLYKTQSLLKLYLLSNSSGWVVKDDVFCVILVLR
jgi:hypothetical protein